MRHALELRLDRRANVRVVVAVARRPPGRNAVDQLRPSSSTRRTPSVRATRAAQARSSSDCMAATHAVSSWSYTGSSAPQTHRRHAKDQLLQSLRCSRPCPGGARRGPRLPHRPRATRRSCSRDGRRRPRHSRVEPGADRCVDRAAHRLRRRRARHRRGRHRARLLRDVQPKSSTAASWSPRATTRRTTTA